MKKSPLLVRSIIVLFIVFLSSIAHGQILVSGTDFDPSPGNASRYYIGLADITQIGLQPGTITSTPPLAANVNPNVFNAGYFYAITPTPIRLDSTRYQDFTPTTDYSYVYSPTATSPGGNVNILSYTVTGLTPGSATSVIVDYCSAVKSTYAPCNGQRNEFKAGINLDASNQLNGNDATQIGMGQCQSATFTGTVDAGGNMVFRMNDTKFGSCVAMAIKKIQIMGIPLPQIFSAQGSEVCAGEQITLQSKLAYNATYQWQVNIAGGGWTNITGGTNAAQLYEMGNTPQSYQFRLQITPLSGGAAITSSPITVNAITCCQVNGVAASRQTIYYDNFGRIDLNDKTGKSYFVWDYSNVLNPVEVAKTTTTPFRWPLVPAPLGATFKATSFLNDGEYCVAGYLTGYSDDNGYPGARLEWANCVTGPAASPTVGLDHSGQKDGACLLINCPANTQGQSIYTRNITNLCFGKQLYFETWIAVFTNSAGGAYSGVNVTLRLTDGGNAANVVTANGTATRQADGGGIWVRIAGNINLVGTSLKMEIINNSTVSANGNDLVIDDIKIMACAPPTIGLYFDLPTLSEAVDACTAPISLQTKASALLKTYYNNAPLYLYQWTRTPNDNTSWTNYGTPMSGETYAISNPQADPAFATLVNGDKVYFRVVAGTALIFSTNNNFTAPTYANKNDPCKNYSVSDPTIVATVKCPSCSKPTAVAITVPAATPAAICEGTAQTLSGRATVPAASLNGGFTYSWFKTAGSGSSTTVPLTTGTATLTVGTPTAVPSNTTAITGLTTNAGTYVLRVEDGSAGNSSCYTEATVVLTVNPKPTISSSPTGTACSGVAQNYTITSAVASTYSWSRALVTGITNAAVTAQTGNPIAEVLTNSTTAAVVVRYVITPTSTTGSCVGTAFNYDVTVNPKPTISSVATGTVCSGVAQNYTITSVVPSSYSWSRALVTGITNAAVTAQTANPIAEVLTNSTTAAVNVVYTITPTSTTGTCAGTPFTYTVTVNPAPTISSSATGTICSGVAQAYTIMSVVPSTYIWSRALVTGITNAAVTAQTTNPITETLTNSTTASVSVVYTITPTSTTGTCAGPAATYTVVVNPKPVISSSPTGTVCSDVAQNYTITSVVPSSYSWSRALVTGITNTAVTAQTANPIAEVLTNTTSGGIVVRYIITPTSTTGTCAGTPFNYDVTVNPKPVITSLGTGTVCSGVAQNYAITSNVTSTYAWTRAAVAGITNAANPTGTGTPITEILTNSTAAAVVVRYVITPSAGCAGTPFNYDVTVNPAPTISSSATGTVCSGVAQNYTITSVIPSSYSWSRAAVAGITNAAVTAQTANPITEILTNSTAAAVNAVYTITPTATTGTCAGIPFTYTVTVNPKPTISSVATGSVCSGVAQNYTITSAVASSYSWSRTAVAGITNGAVTAQTANPIAEILTNSTTSAVNAVYTITPTSTAGTCAGTPFTYTVTVNPKPTITSLATGTTCTGVALNYLITSDVASNYSWSRAAVTGITNAANTGTSNPITENLTSTATGPVVVRYVITPTSTTGTCAGAAFNYDVTVSATAAPTVAVTTTPGTTICDGTPVTFTTVVGSGGTPTYKWTSDKQTGTISTADSYSSSTLINGEVITVEITSSLGCAVPKTATTSVPMTVNANVTPSVTAAITAPTGTICPSSNVTFTATPTNEGAGPKYQWYKGTVPGTLINGATNVSYQTTGATNGDNYYVELTSNATCASPAKVNSTPVSLTVTAVPAPTVTIGSDKTSICSGNPVVFTATPGGTGITTPAPTYQWYIGSTAVNGETNATFTTSSLTEPAGPPATPGSNAVHVTIVSNSACTNNTAVSSNTITITVNPGVLPGSISTGSSFCSGTTPGAITELTPATGITGSAVYTWEQNTTNPINAANWVPATGTPTNGGKGFTPGGTATTDISYRRTVTDNTLPSACQSATTNAITYTVIALPSISSASSGTICSGIAQNYTITSAIPSSYVWSRGTVTGITNAAIGNQISNPITETLVNTTSSSINVAYSIVPTSTSGSCAGATFTYTVTVNPLPNVTPTSPELICSGVSHTYTITSDIASTYSWTRASVANISPLTGSGTTSSITETLTNQTIGTASPADIIVNYVITPTSSAGGCVGPQVTYKLTVAVAAVPTVSVTANKTGICAGVPVKYTATGTATGGSPTYQWYQSSASNPAGIPVGTNSTTYTTTDLASSTDKVWVVMTSNFPCIAVGSQNPVTSAPVSIEVKQAPKPQIETDQVICSADGSFTYTATNLQSNSTLQWQLNAQNISKATELTYNATQSGLYTVVEDNGYCTGASSTSKLTIVPTPDPYAGSDMYVTEGTFVQLQAGGGITGTTYNWTPPTGLNSTTVSNPSFKADNTITYTVTLTNTDAASGHKCFADASVTITVVKPIVVPNVITVNGDGNNDTWHIQHIEGYPNATFEIYNRWGNLVWKSTGYSKEWDGTNFRNGEVLPDGTYFYIINLHSQIFTEPYTGWIQIVK